MLAEWSVECAAEDPVLVVPWKDPDGDAAFVDLRANPYDLDSISEAEQYPSLMHALRALNAARSPVFTAKCDAWIVAGDDLEALRVNLDIGPDEAHAGFASYIDFVWRERAVFTSFHQQEQTVQRLVRLAGGLPGELAAIECVVRPAIVDLEGPQEGYAVSLYVKAVGVDAHGAIEEWGTALSAVVGLMRGRDLAR